MEMMNEEYADLLEAHGIRPTGNRIVIVKTLARRRSPLSLRELEETIETIDKSNLSRTLSLFRQKDLVHAIEGSEGIMLFELCRSKEGHESDNDEHVHFFCTRCHRTFCMTETPVPEVALPEGYRAEAVNCLVKGVCKDCARRQSTPTGQKPS